MLARFIGWLSHPFEVGVVAVWATYGIMWILLVAAVLVFWYYGWNRRRCEIVHYFTDETAAKYLKNYQGKRKVEEKEALKELEDCYKKEFNGWVFSGAALLLCLLAALMLYPCASWSVTQVQQYVDAGSKAGTGAPSAEPGVSADKVAGEPSKAASPAAKGAAPKSVDNSPLRPEPFLIVMAILGAYLWVLHDVTQKAVNYQFQLGTLYVACFRLLIAAPFAYAVAALLPEKASAVAPGLAFCVGAFPARTVRKLCWRSVASVCKTIKVGEDVEALRNTCLSVDARTADLLEDEGIHNPVQLAYADPIKVSIRTGLGMSYVLCVVNEALLWIYLRDDLKKTRKHGINGAVECGHLLNRYLEHRNIAGGRTETSEYENVLKGIAGELRPREEGRPPENAPENATDNAAKNATDNAAKNGTDNGPKNGTHKAPKNGTDNAAEKAEGTTSVASVANVLYEAGEDPHAKFVGEVFAARLDEQSESTAKRRVCPDPTLWFPWGGPPCLLPPLSLIPPPEWCPGTNGHVHRVTCPLGPSSCRLLQSNGFAAKSR